MVEPRTLSGNDLDVLPGLEKFINRLSPGMELDGRIVDVLGQGVFILRIWGTNILAESNHNLQRFDEVILHVQSTQPKLVFRIDPRKQSPKNGIYA